MPTEDIVTYTMKVIYNESFTGKRLLCKYSLTKSTDIMTGQTEIEMLSYSH